MTAFVKRCLRCIVINVEKSHFEISATEYLKNAWCHQSIVVQDNSFGVVSNGSLAELPTS